MQLIAIDYPGDNPTPDVTTSPALALQNLITQDTLGVFSTRGYTPFMWDYGDFENSPCGTLQTINDRSSGMLDDN